ncbi:hypothetical protein NECAME_06601 [Necator americanus]|uniref:E3 ubiquitin-protein ligase n=1 Tax=Necator americanus TaxID=51031 RepID=W2TTS7_NECAM|nr:hypothetical protein NECAME_06601 [Necator americanus]ETN85054.1 hypothetical protein NECAME_06601 [Necator americanus]
MFAEETIKTTVFVLDFFTTIVKAFSMEPLMWRPFLLLDLPQEYDVLFSRYFQRQCINCNKHSMECGRDACCFIALNSSLIVITREGLAAVWGSVYLDAHGEEDRNLRRGKPLFLSARRVDCLRSDWAEQEFERTGATWSTMASLQQLLKDAHLLR